MGCHAGFAHRWNCQLPGGEHIGDNTAAHGSHQATGYYGDLCRPAALTTQQCESEVEEKLTAATVLQYDTENDETNDQIGEGAEG